jgi:hypothetical protein
VCRQDGIIGGVWPIYVPGGVVIITVSVKRHFLRDKIKRFFSKGGAKEGAANESA